MAVVLDTSGVHTSGHVASPDAREHVHQSLEALEETLIAALRFYWEHPKALVQLTTYPWWREGVRYITTLSK
jgi:hypothetical protein